MQSRERHQHVRHADTRHALTRARRGDPLQLPCLAQHLASAPLILGGYHKAAGNGADTALDGARVDVEQDRRDAGVREQGGQERQPHRIIGCNQFPHLA